MTINLQIQSLVSNRRKQFVKIGELQIAAEKFFNKANALENKALQLDRSYMMDSDIEQRQRLEVDISNLLKQAEQYRTDANKLSTEAYNLSTEAYAAIKNAASTLYGPNVDVACHGAKAMTINGIRYTG